MDVGTASVRTTRLFVPKVMEKHLLDCRGLNCPMPIVRVSQAMNALDEGEILLVQADDPAFAADIEAWAQMTGNNLLSMDEGVVTTANLQRSV